jgi:GTPase Era involved in 16S rRNA processing
VKNIIYSVENEKRSSRVRMLGLNDSAPGSSWLFDRLTGRDQLLSITKIGTDIGTIHNFQILDFSYHITFLDHCNNHKFREKDLDDFKPADVFIFSIPILQIITKYSHHFLFEDPLKFCANEFNRIKDKLNQASVCILTGTMIDYAQSKEEKIIFEKLLNEFAKKHDMLGPVMTSAKENIGIEELKNLIKEAILLSEDKRFDLGL